MAVPGGMRVKKTSFTTFEPISPTPLVTIVPAPIFWWSGRPPPL